MADEFELFLRESLAPRERDEDRLFVARVQAAVAVTERLRMERKAIVRRLGAELAAVAALAAAAIWIGRTPLVANGASVSPWFAALVLSAGFALLVGVATSKGSSRRQESIIPVA